MMCWALFIVLLGHMWLSVANRECVKLLWKQNIGILQEESEIRWELVLSGDLEVLKCVLLPTITSVLSPHP